MDIFLRYTKKEIVILFIYLNALQIVVKNRMKNANLLLLLTARIYYIIETLYNTNFSYVYYCY